MFFCKDDPSDHSHGVQVVRKKTALPVLVRLGFGRVLALQAYNVIMRRLAPIAAFALFLAVPLFAQHGGGGHGGGHGGGFAGHSSFSGGHASGGMRSSAPT
jgi:uncharacterized membrane protein YgcG